jgi:hypothetical protein
MAASLAAGSAFILGPNAGLASKVVVSLCLRAYSLIMWRFV